jgi:hypothetical protein
LHSPDIHVPENPTLLSSPEITSSSPNAPVALFTGDLASIPRQTSATTHAFSNAFVVQRTGKYVPVTFFIRKTIQQSLAKCDFAKAISDIMQNLLRFLHTQKML